MQSNRLHCQRLGNLEFSITPRQEERFIRHRGVPKMQSSRGERRQKSCLRTDASRVADRWPRPAASSFACGCSRWMRSRSTLAAMTQLSAKGGNEGLHVIPAAVECSQFCVDRQALTPDVRRVVDQHPFQIIEPGTLLEVVQNSQLFENRPQARLQRHGDGHELGGLARPKPDVHRATLRAQLPRRLHMRAFRFRWLSSSNSKSPPLRILWGSWASISGGGLESIRSA